MTVDKQTYRILIIEDNPGDFVLVEEFLFEQIEFPMIRHTDNYQSARHILLAEKSEFDIVLLDLSLPDKTGEELIRSMVQITADIPVIVLTGYHDVDFGVKSLSLGASDYILKDELTSDYLYKSVLYSLERKKITSSLKESEKRYNELFQLSPLPMWVIESDTEFFLDVNDAAIEHYGYSYEEFLSMTMRQLKVSDFDDLNEDLKLYPEKTLQHRKRNGNIIQVHCESNQISFKGKEARVILAEDITNQLSYINAIENQNQKLREISYIQSHVIRAPLVRIMGLIDLIKDKNQSPEELEKLLNYLLISADDLDNAIKEITEKTVEANYQINPSKKT